MHDSMIISNKDLFLILKKKYPYAVDELGEEKNKETSIFKDWIELFTSLCELEKFCQAERQINESDFKGDSYHSERMRELCLSLWLTDERIFSYKHQIYFELFQIYQRSLEIYDQRVVGHAPLYWGKQLEPLVAEYYSLHTQHKVRRVNAVLQHPDPDKHFMLANLDYAVVGTPEVQILECKTAGEHGAKLWRDGVPLYVLCQVQHQLAVTGKQAAHVCVLLCGHETKIFKVTRSESVIRHIIQAERQFWDCVEQDIPPSVDASASAAKALQLLYPEHVPLSTADLSEDAEANQQFEQLIQTRQHIEKHQEQFDLLKHQLQAKMQEAERAVFQGGSVTWKRSKDSISLDSKALLKQHPEYLQQFPQSKQGSRRFQIYND